MTPASRRSRAIHRHHPSVHAQLLLTMAPVLPAEPPLASLRRGVLRIRALFGNAHHERHHRRSCSPRLAKRFAGKHLQHTSGQFHAQAVAPATAHHSHRLVAVLPVIL